ncbi:uncharacterized protein LOC106526587 isoform X2 [Austrofundulus limnaeus]|nr:PREDICTED: uncharacterized protein LOC106526587 isoform X2 [Austrofundulus limnaeus]
MEDETFEEELWPPRADACPQKLVRQIRRPEMYTSRKFREEVAPVPLQPKSEPKILPRDPSFSKSKSLQKSLSLQNLTQIETPWENVTLNRCLLVAITIVVLASGVQRLHETFRSHGKTEDEAGLMLRRSGMLHHRKHWEPETSLWEVVFWWLPDLNDDEDEDIKGRKSKRGRTARASRGLRNRSPPDEKLLKQRDGKLKDRRAKKARDKKMKEEKRREEREEGEEAAEDERDEDAAAEQNTILGAKKKKNDKGMNEVKVTFKVLS